MWYLVSGYSLNAHLVDRVPYISDVGMILDPAAPVGDHRPDHPGHTLANATHPTVTPLFRQVRNNFILWT